MYLLTFLLASGDFLRGGFATAAFALVSYVFLQLDR